jgi:hypothetical protein
MSKITLNNLVNLTNQTTAVNTINGNNATIQTAFDNTLSRDGTSPNQMGANLDMNSNRIINLPVPVNDTEPLRKGDLTDFEQFQNSVDLSAALAQAQASANASATSATNSANSASAAASSASDAANSASSASTSATNAAASAALAATYASSQYINVFSYIPSGQIPAIQNGTTTYDASADIMTALAAAKTAGQGLFFPKGTYLLQNQVRYVDPATSGLVQAPQIIGAGLNNTIFKNQVAGAQLTNAFTTSTGSAIVTVNWPNHGLAVNDVFTIMNVGSHSYGGLDMEGDWAVTSVPNANTITFNHYAAATSAIANTGTMTYTKPCMYFDTAGGFLYGMILRDFQIVNSGSPIGSSGIRFRRAWNVLLDHIWVNGATADGLHVPCVLGDPDSTAQYTIRNCRFNNCGRWGMAIHASASTVAGVLTGYNEISNGTILNTTVDTCGGGQSNYKYGGGFKWKGQVIFSDNLVFTTNSNCAIYIPVQGGAGLPSVFNYSSLVLENNTGTNFYIEGLDTMVGQCLEMYNNNSFVATAGLNMTPNLGGVIRNININSSVIRATAGNNPYVAFNGTGANFSATTTRIYTPSFQNFGFPGQTQVAGFTFRT